MSDSARLGEGGADQTAAGAGASSGPSRVHSYLELCRIYLVPTAMADSFAGFALAAAFVETTPDPLRLLLVATISVLVYAAGMVTNDLFDLSKDRESAPKKPLPAGHVSVIGAGVFAALLIAGAVGLASLCGAILPTALIFALVFAYNGGGKRVAILGNVLMGGCRAGNWILGAVVAGAADGTSGWSVVAEWPVALGAGLLGAFITIVTAVSLLEDRSKGTLPSVGLGSTTLLVPLILVLQAPAFSEPEGRGAWIGAILLAVLLVQTIFRTLRTPPNVPPAAVFVRGALGRLPAFDAALVLALAPSLNAAINPALALYALGFFAWWCKRRWLQSGGPET